MVNDGDALEKGTNVSFVITPKEGYTISEKSWGKFKIKSKYEETDFNFSKLNKKWNNAIEEIKINKE